MNHESPKPISELLFADPIDPGCDAGGERRHIQPLGLGQIVGGQRIELGLALEAPLDQVGAPAPGHGPVGHAHDPINPLTADDALALCHAAARQFGARPDDRGLPRARGRLLRCHGFLLAVLGLGRAAAPSGDLILPYAGAVVDSVD